MYIPEIPNNSLMQEIKEIIRLSQELEDDYMFDYKCPISEEEITVWENEHNISIPNTIKDWLHFSNGCVIRNYLMHIYSLSEFDLNRKDMPEDLIIIGEVLGDGEFIAFSKNTGKIIWEDHGSFEEYSDLKGVLEEIIRILNDDCGLSQSSLDALMSLVNKSKNSKENSDLPQ